MLGDYTLVTPPTVKRQLSFFGVILTKLGIAVGFLIEGNLGILNIIYDVWNWMYQTRQKFEKQFCKNVDAIVLKNVSHPITPSSRKMYLFTKFMPAQITLTSNICQAPIKHYFLRFRVQFYIRFYVIFVKCQVGIFLEKVKIWFISCAMLTEKKYVVILYLEGNSKR